MNMRLVVLVSSDTSDIYFANQLIKAFSVAGVIVEKQRNSSAKSSRIVKALKMTVRPLTLINRIAEEMSKWKIAPYLNKNVEIDRQQFGKDGETLFVKEGCEVYFTKERKDINAPRNVDVIRQLAPDLIAVCGTSILKSAILTIPPRGVVNLHGGLAQEYRGVWTTQWALINDQPEHIGATVHYVNEGIDDGNIIYQGRPVITHDDNPATLYVKVVKLGIEMMKQAIRDIEGGDVKSYPLTKKGKLYVDKMMTNQELGKAWKRTEKGVVLRYLKDKAKRDPAVEAMMIGRYT
jgi:methionyl-tRNA formyltransferase